jgi:hypothetical protein
MSAVGGRRRSAATEKPDVDGTHGRQDEGEHDAEGPDADLDERIGAQWMHRDRDDPCEEQAAEKHPPHEARQEDAERERRGADNQAQ